SFPGARRRKPCWRCSESIGSQASTRTSCALTMGHVVAELRNDAANFDLIASMIAYRMVEHVLTLPTDRLRICHGPNCSWLFIDGSKASLRRWCDMRVCGNDAKSRRFHARLRQRRK